MIIILIFYFDYWFSSYNLITFLSYFFSNSFYSSFSLWSVNNFSTLSISLQSANIISISTYFSYFFKICISPYKTKLLSIRIDSPGLTKPTIAPKRPPIPVPKTTLPVPELISLMIFSMTVTCGLDYCTSPIYWVDIDL